ncbi:MAG: SMC-Scp complex subunit ScpB, partial [candidate division NC10 bacterium]
MPALELAQETGKVLRWLKSPGDTVRKGQPLVEIETDKVTTEIEDIRGVTTSKGSIDVLLQTGWIRPLGRRKAPGRPLTYGTNAAQQADAVFASVG